MVVLTVPYYFATSRDRESVLSVCSSNMYVLYNLEVVEETFQYVGDDITFPPTVVGTQPSVNITPAWRFTFNSSSFAPEGTELYNFATENQI